MSIFGAGHEVVTSTTKPSSPSVGQLIYCTDTDEYLKYVVDLNSTSRWMQASLKPNRNLIINGGMSVAQRGTSTASITSQGYYSADRWQFNVSSTGTWTMSTENDAPTGSGLRKSTKLLVTTSTGSPSFCQFKQPIEGQNLQSIAKGTASAKQLTLSFWVKESTSAGSYPKTYICELYDNTNTRQVSATYTISAASTWEKKTITFPVDATGAFSNDNLAALDVAFGLGFSSTFTSGTLNTVWGTAVSANRYVGQTNLAANTNNFWQVTGVQLEVGSAPSEFEFEPFETTLRKCQRYYAASLNSSDTFHNNYVFGFNSSSLYNHVLHVNFPCTMRIVPTLTVTFINQDNAINGGQHVHTNGFTQYYRCSNSAFQYLSWRAYYNATAEL